MYNSIAQDVRITTNEEKETTHNKQIVTSYRSHRAKTDGVHTV